MKPTMLSSFIGAPDMNSTLIAILMLAGLALAVLTSEAHAHESDCSAATQRDATAEYDTIAGMVGMPAGAPIYTLEKRQYVAAVCLHEDLRGK